MPRSLLLFALIASAHASLAAPYYEQENCNDPNKTCLWGTPSKRVAKVFQLSEAKSKIGNRCELFGIAVQNEIVRASRQMGLKPGALQIQKFTYRDLIDQPSNESHSIDCRLEIHAEDANLVLIKKNTGWHTWINPFDPKECVADRNKLFYENPLAVGTHYLWGSSLLQGSMCTIGYYQVMTRDAYEAERAEARRQQAEEQQKRALESGG
ncbi:MAG: hypothetical protein AB7N80_07995 [Bdellovibrionales bacterium]